VSPTSSVVVAVRGGRVEAEGLGGGGAIVLGKKRGIVPLPLR
jgi:hypothetical protein